jgi:hypothetical protein
VGHAPDRARAGAPWFLDDLAWFTRAAPLWFAIVADGYSPPVSGRSWAGRRRLSGLTACLVLGSAWCSVSCAPQAPDHSSWRDQAHLSIEDVASNVSTMSLVLRLVREDRMFGKYQQIVALNSETNAGRTADHFSAEQPEPRDDATYTRVTGLLSDATDLLSEVRIALVRRDSHEYADLAEQLDTMSDRLDRAESEVTAVDP